MTKCLVDILKRPKHPTRERDRYKVEVCTKQSGRPEKKETSNICRVRRTAGKERYLCLRLLADE